MPRSADVGPRAAPCARSQPPGDQGLALKPGQPLPAGPHPVAAQDLGDPGRRDPPAAGAPLADLVGDARRAVGRLTAGPVACIESSA